MNRPQFTGILPAGSRILPPQGGSGTAPPQSTWEVYKCPVLNRFFDPFKVFSNLHYYAQGKLNDLISRQDDPAAGAKLAMVGRRAFDLPDVDAKTGQGVPDAVVLSVVEKFAEYVQGKGDGAGRWQNYAQPRAFPAGSAPKSCSDCP